MRKLLILIALLSVLLIPKQAFASPAFVQQAVQNVSNGSAATTALKAYPSNNTGGNLLYVTTFWLGSTINASVTDSQGNTYTPLAKLTRTAGQFVQSFYVLNAKAGANTVTFSYSGVGATFIGVFVGEWSGVNAIDQNNGQSGSSATPASPSVTTTHNGELLIGYAAMGSTTWTAGGAWTMRSNPTTAQVIAVEDQLNIATGSYSSLFGSNNGSWAAGITTFYLIPPVMVPSYRNGSVW